MHGAYVEETFGSSRWLIAVLALASFSTIFLIWHGPQPCDDAYITFRHAKNLAEHMSPAWNLEGPPVMGSTTPAYLSLLGVLGCVFGVAKIPVIALWVNAFFQLLIVVLAYTVMHDLVKSRLAGILGAALIGFNGVNLFIFSMGFENAMLIAILLASFYALRTGRTVPSVVLASLAPLVRPEGILAAPLVLGHIFLARRFQWKVIPALLAIPLLWTVFATAYYGSPIPHSISAKKKFPSVYRPYTSGEVNLQEHIFDLPSLTASFLSEKAAPILFNGGLDQEAESWTGKVRMWITILAMPFLVIFFIRKPDSRLIYLLYPPLFVLLYAWIGRTEIWYFPSFVTFSILLVFSAIYIALEILNGWAGRFTSGCLARWKIKEGLYLAVSVLFFTANQYAFNHGAEIQSNRSAVFLHDPRGGLWEWAEVERYNGYRLAAQYINDHAQELRPALTSEVGVFGFFYEGPVLDAVGLCSPEVLAFYPPPPWDIYDENGQYRTFYNNFTPTQMVLALKPAYVVNARPYIANLLVPDSAFLEVYIKLRSIGKAWGQPILVFREEIFQEAGRVKQPFDEVSPDSE